MTWKPHPRPEWVTLLNTVGTGLGSPAAVVPLDENSLLTAAQAATGLDDFGDDEWREPFRILLEDIENESDLTLTGRLLTRIDILRSLVVRLQMRATEAQHPEILEQPIEAPIVITGLGRTGTTFLHELLSQDSSFRAPAGWEYRHPSPPPTLDSLAADPRVALTASEVDLWLEVVPEFRPIHEMSVEAPEEDTVAHMHEFTSQTWPCLNRAPNYDAYLIGGGMDQAFKFQRRVMQHLQWKKPGRWLIKGIYVGCLPSLFTAFPDAQVIMTHRDPLKVMASTANTFATLRWQRSDSVHFDEIGPMVAFGYAIALNMVLEQRQTGVVPDERFVDVRYAELMADYSTTISHVYESLGLPLTAATTERMRAFVESKPKGRHGAHSYDFGDLGVDRDEVRAMVAPYLGHFGVTEETL